MYSLYWQSDKLLQLNLQVQDWMARMQLLDILATELPVGRSHNTISLHPDYRNNKARKDAVSNVCGQSINFLV
jgi:hypothetical protein